MSRTTTKLSAWIALSRPPFHTVGVLPFILGNVIAWRVIGTFRWSIFAWGAVGVIAVMLATYYAGEYWDYREDSLSLQQGGSLFAGGSRVVQRGLLPRATPFWGSLASLTIALLTAGVLCLVYRTGPWTLAMGAFGVFGGFFYSTRPIRWVERGLGELWVGVCYSWLPVAAGCYLQVGEISPVVHWLSVPIGLTIFNVVLLNEYPDYQVDRSVGKKNLVVRLGRTRSSILYALLSVGSWAAVWASINHGAPVQVLWLHLPVLALSALLVLWVVSGRWRRTQALERLCGANLAVNLGTTLAYIVAFAL